MLTGISVRNLACFSDEGNHIDLAPETVIIGPNNVGKSAFIAALNALNVLVHGEWNFDRRGLYSWNSFDDIVHRHEGQRKIQLGAIIQGPGWSGPFSALITRARPPDLSGPLTKGLVEEFGRVWYLKASRTELPRQMQVGERQVYLPWQPLNPDGSNVIVYLLERFTSRDPRWAEAEKWLNRIAPEVTVLKTPLRVVQTSVETTDAKLGLDINMTYQGTGIQKALSIIAALVFSPEGSTIVIEEPETNLHARSQEGLADLFNLAVNEWNKQVVFTTHSWDMLLPFVSDVGKGKGRGEQHPKANPDKFKLIVFNRVTRDGTERIETKELDIKNMDFMTLRDHLKKLWG